MKKKKNEKKNKITENSNYKQMSDYILHFSHDTHDTSKVQKDKIIDADGSAYAKLNYVYALTFFYKSDIQISVQRHIRIVCDDLNYADEHMNYHNVHMYTHRP